jgi:hypothetical protein
MKTSRKSKGDQQMDKPRAYRIQIRGKLDKSWSEWFNGMNVTVAEEPDGTHTTTLDGTFSDQAALHGVLAKIGFFNLLLTSVTLVGEGEKEELR